MVSCPLFSVFLIVIIVAWADRTLRRRVGRLGHSSEITKLLRQVPEGDTSVPPVLFTPAALVRRLWTDYCSTVKSPNICVIFQCRLLSLKVVYCGHPHPDSQFITMGSNILSYLLLALEKSNFFRSIHFISRRVLALTTLYPDQRSQSS